MKVLSVTLARLAGISLNRADSKPLKSCRVMELQSDRRAASPGSFEIKHSTPVPTVRTWQNKSRVYILAFLYAIKNKVIKCVSLSNPCIQNMKNLLPAHCFKTGCMCLAKKKNNKIIFWNKLQCESVRTGRAKGLSPVRESFLFWSSWYIYIFFFSRMIGNLISWQ